ncbi:MAG: hypothetical protein DRJ02_03055 [Bacteroidetes bacterium]|nr:MAG: hypothetical protein DRJ02_03055 [Bacteroidota bacterium]
MKKLLLNFSMVIAFVGGILFLHGCYPDNSLTYDQTDLSLTGYYDSVDFNKITTYFMPDTVFPLRDDTTDKTPIEGQDLILSQIAKNMESYGYTRIYPDDNSPEPDVMVTASAIMTTTVSVGWWYPYYPGWGWGWYWWKKSPEQTSYWYPYYPGYYPPGWGWGGVPYYSTYTTGTLMLEMANPEDYRIVDGDTVVPLYWAGGLNGILSGSSNEARVKKGIDQLFIQSPYLNNN